MSKRKPAILKRIEKKGWPDSRLSTGEMAREKELNQKLHDTRRHNDGLITRFVNELENKDNET